MEKIKAEPPTTSELFQKHFGEVVAVDLKHSNIENFFNELNEVCKKEDEPKNAKPLKP